MSIKLTLEQQLTRLKMQKAQALADDLKKREELPHLYRFKDYSWSKEFIDSRNKRLFLVAANQLGKSTSQIRKVVTWATSPDLWKELWSVTPNLFWYLYPTGDVATYEFETKWVDILPRGAMKDDPVYGWKEFREGRHVKGIRFNSGILLLFKSYTQDVQHLQSGTVFWIACDEELPFHLWDELKFRLNAVNGYFSMVFTATLGQEEWRCTMEEQGTPKERFKGAHKIHASLYDSQKFLDGTPSRWTSERISEVVADCSTEAEVNKRVGGRFALGTERKISSFDPRFHCQERIPLPKEEGWQVFGGLDYGSGGETGHPGSVILVLVNGSFTKAVVKKAWKGDKTYRTDSGYILNKYRELKGEVAELGFNNFHPAKYDPAAADLGIIGEQLGEPLNKADKSRERGTGVIDTLFRNNMLFLDIAEPFVSELSSELLALKDINKTRHKKGDDLFDALRYTVIDIPFDWATGVELKRLYGAVADEVQDIEVNELQRARDEFKKMISGELSPESPLEQEFREYEEQLYG